MLKRIKQFVAAMKAHVTEKDKNYVLEHLTNSEAKLFWGMNLPDCYHVLNVSYTAEKLAQHTKLSIDKSLLIKCALLHDVGKVKGDVSTFDKVLTVLGHGYLPTLSKKWGKFGRAGRIQNLRHAFYIYYYHGERGANMLAAIGEPQEIVDIVRKHHALPEKYDPPELILLRQADELN